MNISYSEPLSRGWNRMKKALFQPFNIETWFTLGFTVFLADLMSGGGPGGGGNFGNKYNDFDWHEIANYPDIARLWLAEHTFLLSLIIVGTFVLIAILLVFTWLSSRGKFMFLDNVIHSRAEVVKPWNEYRAQGNSLFIWRLIYGIICFLAITASLIFSGIILFGIFTNDAPIQTQVFSIIGIVLQFLILIIIMSFVSLFLNDFVVPIMYKDKISTSKAWFKFLPVFSKHIGYFIIYGLFIFVLTILVVISVILFGLFTCCLGFLLLIIPYISSVVFLPISYTFRAFSVEFLEQFSDSFSFFPKQEELNETVSE
jgi:hypothetical protein